MAAWWTGRSQGDLGQLGMGAPLPSPALAGRPVQRLQQVHGAGVFVSAVGAVPGDDPPEADAVVAAAGGQVLAVLTADCAAVALGSAEGVYGAVHAGWRGLLAGVVEEAVSALRGVGATEVVAGLGPCIGPCCYEFAGDALDALSYRYGDEVRGRTTDGAPALDLPAGVRQALETAGAKLAVDDPRCTGCSGGFFSHRRRSEPERQALLVWRVGTPSGSGPGAGRR